VRRALPKNTNREIFPCPFNPTATRTNFIKGTIHKIPPKKNIKSFFNLLTDDGG